MESSYLGKAFKAFDDLNEELFDVTDAGIQALDKFYDGDDTDVIAIIDADAEEEEDLEDSYVGKVILECPVCESMVYKDTDDIHVDEDTAELVNVDEECPCCHTVGGFHIIGTVAPYEEEKEEEEVEVKDETEEITEASDDDDSLDESCGKKKHRKLKEDPDQDEYIDFRDTVDNDDEIADYLADIALDILEEWGESEASIQGFNGTVSFVRNDGKKFTWDYREEFEDCREMFYDSDSEDELRDKMTEYFKEKIDFGTLKESCDKKRARRKPMKEDVGDESKGSIYDEVLKFLDDMGYDVADSAVKVFAEEAAEYIEFARAQKDGHYSVRQWYKETEANFPEELEGLKKIVTEGLERVSVTTDKEHIEMHADEDGKVTVTTEPKKVEDQEEVIVPVDDEVVDEIEHSEEKEEFDDSEDEDEVDIDITDFDEEKFDELAEKFLTSTYDNVAGYKTTSGGIDGDKIVLEGVISYKSGKEVPTKYIFESVDLDENNRLRLVGSNKGLTAHKKPFTMKGFVEGKKLIAESLDYDFESKCAKTGKRTHVKGSL